MAKQIADEFSAGFEPIEQLIEVIKLFFEERQDLYDRIASTIIPVIVYTGDENNLPEIFDRINSQGTPLDQYEVYAVAWPVKQKFAIKKCRDRRICGTGRQNLPASAQHLRYAG